jgi:hypothetical protein
MDGKEKLQRMPQEHILKAKGILPMPHILEAEDLEKFGLRWAPDKLPEQEFNTAEAGPEVVAEVFLAAGVAATEAAGVVEASAVILADTVLRHVPVFIIGESQVDLMQSLSLARTNLGI